MLDTNRSDPYSDDMLALLARQSAARRAEHLKQGRDMTLVEIILARFGPLMSYAQLGELFGYSGPSAASAMRQRLRRDSKLGNGLQEATLRLGRRIYFRADLVAATLDIATGTAKPVDNSSPVSSQ